MTNANDHEKIFEEICSQLSELSHNSTEQQATTELPTAVTQQIAMTMEESPREGGELQEQMKKFQFELKETQDELIEKIKSLENMNYAPSLINEQVRTIADQLNAERANNTKLSSDLAKSLELCLHLQLEIQGLKAKMVQVHTEEKKYSHSLFEKNKLLQRDLQLNIALKDEVSTEFEKAKISFANDMANLNKQVSDLSEEKAFLIQANEELHETILHREQEIKALNTRLENISEQFNEVEHSASQQNDVLKNLMEVAEAKIIELKIGLDKKAHETQDLQNQLQQVLAQTQLLRQENVALKDYINKVNYYQQQMQIMQQQAMQSNPIGNA